jgi:hypothetical protein
MNPEVTTLAKKASDVAQARLQATSHLPPGTFVNVAIRAGDLAAIANAIPSSAPTELRELAQAKTLSIVGLPNELEVAAPAREIVTLCAAISPP